MKHMLMFKVFTCVLLLGPLARPVFGDGVACRDASLIGWVFSERESQDIAVSGNTAYVAAGLNGDVQVFDVSDPASPSLVGAYVRSEAFQPWRIVADGEYVYVFDRFRRLFVLDMSSPWNPTLVRFLNLPEWPFGVDRVGDLFYIASRSAGLVVVDVQDPANPVIVGSSDAGYVEAVRVRDGIAYLAVSGEGFRMLDVSDVSNITVLGSLDLTGTTTDIELAGDFAFIADRDGVLYVVNIEDSALPVEVGQLDAGSRISSIRVFGDRAYILNESAQMLVYDLSMPGALALLGSYNLASNGIGLTVVENLAYVITSFAGVQIVDISNPINRSSPTVFSFDGFASTWDIEIVGTTMYVADGPWMRILDISNRASPVELVSLNTPGSASGLEIVGNILYLADSSGGMRIFDVTDPQQPIEISVTPTAEPATSVYVQDQIAYLAAEDLVIVDVADPFSPVVLSVWNMNRITDIFVDGMRVYVTDSSSNLLRVFDVVDPINPVLLGEMHIGFNEVSDVHVVDDIAYVAAGNQGMYIVDVSEPALMSMITTFHANDRVVELTVRDSIAYLGTSMAGVHMVDISVPGQPRFLGSTQVEMAVSDIELVGERAYISSATAGAVVLDISSECGCSVDINNDGHLNFFDVSAFLQLFRKQNPAADLTGDGIINFFDISQFLQDYAAGCP